MLCSGETARLIVTILASGIRVLGSRETTSLCSQSALWWGLFPQERDEGYEMSRRRVLLPRKERGSTSSRAEGF